MHAARNVWRVHARLLEAVDHLRRLVEQVDAARDAEGLEEGLVGREVAVEQALVVLEDVHAHAVQLHHEDGEHRDHLCACNAHAIHI